MQGVLTEEKGGSPGALRPVFWILLLGGLGHTLVCWVTLQLDFFRGGWDTFSTLFAFFWTGHLSLIAFTALRQFAGRGSDMILPVMAWTTAVVLISAYHVDQVRLCVMITFFAILQVGVFRVRFPGFAVLSSVTVLAYGLIIHLVVRWHPEAVDVTAEIIQWGGFTVMTVAFVLLAAEISSIRVRLAQRNDQLGDIVERIQEMAIKDELTGLYNRRHAMERLRKIREMANRGAFDFVVAYVDLDHFKRVNDSHGHSVGDDVLRVFAEKARSLVSGRDFCARLGGEEFLIVLVKTDMDQARQLAEQLRRSMAETEIVSAPGLHVTTSVGLARFRRGEWIEDLLARADGALYKAKESGRNRVVCAGEGSDDR
jgi:diguanylate cyclase (GGDEF)-like protein